MQQFFLAIWESIASLYNPDRWFLDIIDIAFVAYLIYKGTKLVRETRAAQLVKGILFIAVSYFLASQLKLITMEFLLKNVFEFGIIAVVVVFQPELRRALEKVGRSKLSLSNVLGVSNQDAEIQARWRFAIDPICEACSRMSGERVGALIVLERMTKLGDVMERATIIDAIPSIPLITNIFFHNSPLHDGGLIVRDGRLYAASCFFIPSDKVENISLGSRHRAALGVSEVSDALVIVVSEETGIISVAHDGVLERNFTKETLKQRLTEELLPAKPGEEKDIKKSGFWKVNSK